MTPDQIIFILCAILIIAAALMVVSTRNLIHAALWLIAALFGVAVLFALLQAGFLALVQVVVYIGAIAILFIFAVMLTRRDMRDKGPQLNQTWGIAAFLAVLTFGSMVFLLSKWRGSFLIGSGNSLGTDSMMALGKALVSPDAYVLPFEVASILLLAALVGSIYIATASKK
jgi:NADH-quinone oxidoreductase subunit J